VTNIIVEPVAGPVQSYTFPDLPPGDYQFRVRALFPDGVVGEWSHVLEATAEVLGTVGVSVSAGLPLPTVAASVEGAVTAQVSVVAGLPLPTVSAEAVGTVPAEVTITAGCSAVSTLQRPGPATAEASLARLGGCQASSPTATTSKLP
jgi:hypothetical protein